MFDMETGEIEKGDTLEKITKSINKEHNLDLSVEKIAKVSWINNMGKLIIWNRVELPGKNLELLFDNRFLWAYDKTYNVDYESLKWEGTSWSDFSGYAPITNWIWTANPEDIEYHSDAPFIHKAAWLSYWLISPTNPFEFPYLAPFQKHWLRPGSVISWWSVRTELDNLTTWEVKTWYYIHWWITPGSAGCIDLWRNEKDFHNWFSERGKRINIKVINWPSGIN